MAGVAIRQPLHWNTVTPQAQQWRDASFNGDILPVGLTEPAQGVYWAAMPTFTPDEPHRAAYHAMADDVGLHRDRYLHARTVVIDLRGNLGGSSDY